MLANLSQESNQARERPGGVHIPKGEENVFVDIRTVGSLGILANTNIYYPRCKKVQQE